MLIIDISLPTRSNIIIFYFGLQINKSWDRSYKNNYKSISYSEGTAMMIEKQPWLDWVSAAGQRLRGLLIELISIVSLSSWIPIFILSWRIVEVWYPGTCRAARWTMGRCLIPTPIHLSSCAFPIEEVQLLRLVWSNQSNLGAFGTWTWTWTHRSRAISTFSRIPNTIQGEIQRRIQTCPKQKAKNPFNT